MLELIELEALLNQKLESTTKIYLDTKFWCEIYDEIRYNGNSDFLNKAREAKKLNKAAFPISYDLIFEISNQNDIAVRNKTLSLMGELSDNVLIRTTKELMEIEVFTFLNTYTPYRFNKLNKFTKIGNAFTNFETDKALIEDLGDDIQIFLPIVKWEANIEMLANSISELKFDNSAYATIASDLNTKNETYENEVKSLKKAIEAELRGAASIYGRIASKAISYISSNPNSSENLLIWERLFYKLLLEERDNGILKIGRIYSHIYAFFRFDKQRKLKGNDLGDFEHSVLALSSFDAFFTDNANKHTLKTLFKKRIYQEKIVGSNMRDLISYLDTLLM